MIIEWIEYIKWNSLKLIAKQSWWISIQTVKNRLKDNENIIIKDWFIYIKK